MGKDGRTAYEIVCGKRCTQAIAEFGEQVHYRRRAPEGEKRNKGEPDWEDGTFLGTTQRTNEYTVGTTVGVVRAYAIRRRPDGEKWVRDLVMSTVGTAEMPMPGGRSTEIPIRVPVRRGDAELAGLEVPPPPRKEEIARRVYLLPRDFEKHGRTPRCKGCQHKGAKISSRNHSAECRARVEAAIREDATEKERVEKAEERIQEGIIRATEDEAERLTGKRVRFEDEGAGRKEQRTSGSASSSDATGSPSGVASRTAAAGDAEEEKTTEPTPEPVVMTNEEAENVGRKLKREDDKE